MTESSPASTVPLTSQVGGHAGVLTSEDGALLIKPALHLEHIFYQTLQSESKFAPLRPFIPKFYGTLKLEGKLTAPDNAGHPVQDVTPVIAAIDESAKPEEKDEFRSPLLQNLSHPFFKPNILDIKLGTVLYDEGATPEKIARMKNTARNTTSLETGLRLTGFQVYDNKTSEPHYTAKTYGKSIKASELPEGMARFFPISSPNSTSGLPLQTLLPILRGIRKDVDDIRQAFAGLEMRMVGGSVLIIYESDWEKAEEGIKFCVERKRRMLLDEDILYDDEDDEDDEDDDSDSENAAKKPSPPYVVKLIDFAHTRIKTGHGPDEGVLLGLTNTLSLLDGRIEQVKSLM